MPHRPTEENNMSFDMNGLLKQAKEVQQRMREMQDELANEHIESISGGGMIKVIVNGQQEVIKIEISPEALEAGAEMLSDMVLVTITDAMKKSRELAQAKIGQIPGGMNLPGLGL